MNEQFEIDTQAVSEEKPRSSKNTKKGFSLFKRVLLCILFLLIGCVIGRVSALYSLLSGNLKSIDNKLAVIQKLVDETFLYDIDQGNLATEVYRGYMKGLKDDYAEYYTKAEFDELMEEDSGEYYGIGVTLYKDPETNYPCVAEVFKDNPAYNAGVKIGDYFVTVEGKNTADMTLQEFIAIVKSPDSQKVKFQILRGHKLLDIIVDKSKISIHTVEWAMKKNNIGYISVSQFIETTPDDFKRALNQLSKKGMKKLIIDLRDNGGGLVNSCQAMLSEFIKNGDLLVYTESKKGDRYEYKSKNESEPLKMPIVILINENTASASEIMTGCLKDYGIATIVGEKSYGKGIVQSVIPLRDGSAVKFTISKYFTPKGNDIHKKGIEPDVEVVLDEKAWAAAQEDSSKDTQLKKAIEILKK